jgi:hypothetical protein
MINSNLITKNHMGIKTIGWDGSVATYEDAALLLMGTQHQGEIECSYSRLLATFGEPESGDGDKTQAEWIIATPDGIAAIYDWKQGDGYLGAGNGAPVEQITQWSIGGHSPKVVEWIRYAIGK